MNRKARGSYASIYFFLMAATQPRGRRQAQPKFQLAFAPDHVVADRVATGIHHSAEQKRLRETGPRRLSEPWLQFFRPVVFSVEINALVTRAR
jgi:hypothetical protein